MNETRMNETRMNETDERHRMWDWLLYPLVAFSMAIQLVLAIPIILLGIVLEFLFLTAIRFGLFGIVDVYWPMTEDWAMTEDWDTMVEGPAETGGANHE